VNNISSLIWGIVGGLVILAFLVSGLTLGIIWDDLWTLLIVGSLLSVPLTIKGGRDISGEAIWTAFGVTVAGVSFVSGITLAIAWDPLWALLILMAGGGGGVVAAGSLWREALEIIDIEFLRVEE
jgi:hypothetical protein